MCLFCVLELLNDPHLESDEIKQVFKFLGPLKEKENMVWPRVMTIRQFNLAWNDGSDLVVHTDYWLGCHNDCQIFEVSGINSEYAVDYYDDDLYMQL